MSTRIVITVTQCRGLEQLGQRIGRMGRREEAISVYWKAIEVDPGNANALCNLADLMDQAGRREDSAQLWRAYLRQDPNIQWGNYAKLRLFLAKKI